MFRIVLLKGDRNDATSFYLDIIRDAIIRAGDIVEYIENISDIHLGDNVVTITPKAFWMVKESRKTKLILHWFQGVAPEEVSFYTYAIWKKLLMRKVYSWLEYFTLRKSDFNFFVSNGMMQHYARKYGYMNNNYFIMPCFNQSLLLDAFTDEKYERPTFVYTGSLSKWQCFEPMLLLYKKIKARLPLATLTIYTKEREKAIFLLRKYDVDAEIKYVSYQQLAMELKEYKYGFILRENNIVNNVATPTKMNSYLASGVIPIYTDVIDDYRKNLSCLEYVIPLGIDNSGIEKLFSFECDKMRGKDVLKDYENIFMKYYNRDLYVDKISMQIRNLLRK